MPFQEVETVHSSVHAEIVSVQEFDRGAFIEINSGNNEQWLRHGFPWVYNRNSRRLSEFEIEGKALQLSVGGISMKGFPRSPMVIYEEIRASEDDFLRTEVFVLSYFRRLRNLHKQANALVQDPSRV